MEAMGKRMALCASSPLKTAAILYSCVICTETERRCFGEDDKIGG